MVGDPRVRCDGELASELRAAPKTMEGSQTDIIVTSQSHLGIPTNGLLARETGLPHPVLLLDSTRVE